MRPLTMDANVPARESDITDVTRAEQSRRRWTLISPVFLILTTLVVFHLARQETSERIAQLLGFAYYWAVGGIVIPMILLERGAYASLFERASVSWTAMLRVGLVALFVPAAFGFLFAFPYLFPAESALLLPALALYALLNGTFEEVFWRGVFIRRFHNNPWLGVAYPGLMFGLWQLVPWALFDTWFRPSAWLLLAVAIPVGLLYGWVAWSTKSIRWTVLAHVLANLSGIGALIIFAPAN